MSDVKRVCKECKEEKVITDFAMSKRVGAKIVYRRVCKVCWRAIQKNKYTKKHLKSHTFDERKDDIIQMRSNGKTWNYIGSDINVSGTYVRQLFIDSLNRIPVH